MSAQDNLRISALKIRLRETFSAALKRVRREAAPLLAQLRKRMNAQGQKGKGFGAWVEQNLPITRRTADLWADEWERATGRRTSRKVSKGRAENGPLQLQFVFASPERRREFLGAWRKLEQEERQTVVVEAVIRAARERNGKASTAAAGR
jgi:hypothetical protein